MLLVVMVYADDSDLVADGIPMGCLLRARDSAIAGDRLWVSREKKAVSK